MHDFLYATPSVYRLPVCVRVGENMDVMAEWWRLASNAMANAETCKVAVIELARELRRGEVLVA